ncbi:hypothetical protein ACJX0J_032918, partial [Zea mays]
GELAADGVVRLDRPAVVVGVWWLDKKRASIFFKASADGYTSCAKEMTKLSAHYINNMKLNRVEVDLIRLLEATLWQQNRLNLSMYVSVVPKVGLITSFCLLVDDVRPFHIFKEFLLRYWSFVMGTSLIPADGEIWRVRRRVIAPALHQK